MNFLILIHPIDFPNNLIFDKKIRFRHPMATPFIDKLALYLTESNVPLQDWVLVLPSERAKQYLQRALYKQFDEPIFAPKMYTIDQWVRTLSPLVVLDKTRLLLELYEIHRLYPQHDLDKSFDEFLNWGNMLLSDFDEIDRYLVDSKMLFRNLRDIKEIENWSFLPDRQAGGEDKELTENQKKYLAFWERLPHYYQSLKERLAKLGATQMGSVYKMLTENTDLLFKKQQNAHFLFAGFNALSLAEMTLFRQLHRMGRGHVLVDSDAYYLNDANHEAGLFIRRMRDFLGEKELPFVLNNLSVTPKHIELVACAQATGQVKVAAGKLASLSLEEINETLVLLADESLIVPLLQNIPKSVQRANITLGLPLKFTSLKTWVNLIFDIQEGFLRYNRVAVYHKDLLGFWNHPLFQETLDESERATIHKREMEIRSRNIIFQSPRKITVSPKTDALLHLLYTPWENSWEKALLCIRSLNKLLYEAFSEQNEYERAIIQCFDAGLVDFQNVLTSNFPEMSLRSFKQLFNQEWMRENIAYYGNPMEGLQIMGLLETRLLDFKRIIVLGLNEGKMPPTNPIQSLIPMDLRVFAGMPTPRDKQGLFAHHFYRLLHHAEEVLLTYHQGAEGLGFSEKSRFIAQLELELGKQNPKVTFIRRDYTLMQAERNMLGKSVAKTPEIQARLDELFAAGTSVSMLKNYFRCPLDFYYQHVLKFGEEQKIEEELEISTFGTLIHGVLEDMYQPYNQEKASAENEVPSLTVAAIDQMLAEVEKRLFEAFKTHFNGEEAAFETGKNYLSFSVSIDLTKRFLNSEKSFLKNHPEANLQIIGLEKSLETEIELEIFGQQKKIRLRGFVDRIDAVDGAIRIIDYKTGKVNKDDVGKNTGKFSGSMVEFLTKQCKESKHFFQLLTYVFLYVKTQNKLPSESAIISFISSKNNPHVMVSPDLSYESLMDLYPEILQAILTEIYDPSTHFEHKPVAPKMNFCAYCN